MCFGLTRVVNKKAHKYMSFDVILIVIPVILSLIINFDIECTVSYFLDG